MRSSASSWLVSRKAADVRLKTELKAPKGTLTSITRRASRDTDGEDEEVVTFHMSLGLKVLVVVIVVILDVILQVVSFIPSVQIG